MTIEQERNLLIVLAIILFITVGEVLYNNHSYKKEIIGYKYLTAAYEHQVKYYEYLSDFYRTKDTTLEKLIELENDSCNTATKKVEHYMKITFNK